MSYLTRNHSSKINDLLKMFPIVAILGPRQCGKTTLVKDLRENWDYFDLENPDHYDRIINDPVFFFDQHPNKVIIDEAQLSPELFKVLRGIIDQDRDLKGRFLITGSSSYELIKNISESLAGRIATVELGTFKVNEAYSVKLPEIYKLFSQGADISFLKGLKSELTPVQFKSSFFWGGQPEVITQKKLEFYNVWMSEYYSSYINRDIRSLFPKLDLVRYRRFLQMIAQLTGTVINKADLARSVEVSEKTIRDYFEIAHGSYVWRIYNSFEKSQIKSVTKMPKGGMRDSGLLNYILKIDSNESLENSPYVGRLFENFAAEEIIKGISSTMATNWDYSHYRTKNKAEIDLIIDSPKGIVPIEIKYGKRTRLRDLTTLKEFVKRNNLEFGILINNADKIEQISNEIIQIPIHYW